MILGCLGPKGSFSDEVANIYAKNNEDLQVVFSQSIESLFNNLEQGIYDEAMIPVENSIEGAVNATLDMFAGTTNLKIKHEILHKISQNLIVKKHVALDEIEAVLSHPQALGQCREYLATNLPQAELIPTLSTSAAIVQVMQLDSSVRRIAAIGTATAAITYDLKILAKDIEDSSNNVTRFLVVSNADSSKSGEDKSSIVFSTEDKPGSLYRILDIFNLWDINLTKIESRPSKKLLGKYVFFVDLEGHREDDAVRDALVMVQKKTSFYKFLGSYTRID